MSTRSQERRKARKTKQRSRWTGNENTLRVDGPQGVEDFSDLAYLFNRRESPPRRLAQSNPT